MLHLQPAKTTLHSHCWTLRKPAKPLRDSASAACLWSWCKSTPTEVHPPRFTVCTSAVCKARVTAGNASPQGQACLDHLAAYGLVVASTALTSPSLSCARGLNSCVATRPDLRNLREYLTATLRTSQTADLGLLMPRVQQHRAADSVKPVHLGTRRKSRLIARKIRDWHNHESSQHHSSTSTRNSAPHGLEDCERKLAGQPVGLWK